MHFLGLLDAKGGYPWACGGPHGDSQLRPNVSSILQMPLTRYSLAHMTLVSYESEPSMPGLGDAPHIIQEDITRVTEMEKFLGQQKAKMIVSKINHVIW